MLLLIRVVFLTILISLFQPIQAQVKDSIDIKDSFNQASQSNSGTITPAVPKKPVLNSNAENYHTTDELRLTGYLLFFAAFVLSVAAFLLYKFSHDCNVTFKYFVIILLILGMLLLIAIGLDKDQISPAVGLFGTIAGYLLGKSDPQTSTGLKKDNV